MSSLVRSTLHFLGISGKLQKNTPPGRTQALIVSSVRTRSETVGCTLTTFEAYTLSYCRSSAVSSWTSG